MAQKNRTQTDIPQKITLIWELSGGVIPKKRDTGKGIRSVSLKLLVTKPATRGHEVGCVQVGNLSGNMKAPDAESIDEIMTRIKAWAQSKKTVFEEAKWLIEHPEKIEAEIKTLWPTHTASVAKT